jgi:alkylmercury lyase
MNTEMRREPLTDLETLVRGPAFRLLITNAEPIASKSLAEVTGIEGDRLTVLLEDLDRAGRIRRDHAGRVVGSAGLSVVPDRHAIEIEGRRFWTWCAYDILGIFGALRASGRASSPIPTTRDFIRLDFVDGRPQNATAVLFRPEADLMSCCENVYEEWCPNSNLFANRAAARRWATEHGVKGRVLKLEEAADLATKEWKPLTDGVYLGPWSLPVGNNPEENLDIKC